MDDFSLFASSHCGVLEDLLELGGLFDNFFQVGEVFEDVLERTGFGGRAEEGASVSTCGVISERWGFVSCVPLLVPAMVCAA